MALRGGTGTTWRARVATLVALFLITGTAHASTLIGLTTANALIRFDSASPGTIAAGPIAITGLSGGEAILGIDYRPANAKLYGLSSLNRLYIIDVTTGVATLVGTLTVALSGTDFGIDINPMVDRVRVVSDADQNMRLNPDTGVVVAVDSPLAFAAGDPHAGANPTLVGSAYTNSFAGATATALYGIDTNFDVLITQNPPNNGALNTVGSLGVNASAVMGFDIEAPSNTGFAALTVLASSGLYTINLATGAATLIGSIGGGVQVRGLAVVPYASSLIGLTPANTLIRFDAGTPGTIIGGPTPITGLDPGETMIGIDYRPATGVLYGVSSASRLFTINGPTGAATLVAPLSTTLTGVKFGVDFNPVPDRIRLVSSTLQNWRINPDTGTVIVDTTLAYAPSDPNAGMTPFIAESAYTNSFAGATSTSLYGIDPGLDVLVLQNPPNNGTLNTVGPLGVNASSNIGFEIEPGLNLAFAAMQVSGTSSLYRINLTTGAATVVGAIGGGHQLIGLAAVLFAASPAANVIATGAATQINVTWSAVTGAHHYDVYRQSSTGSGFVAVASVQALQLDDTTVTPGAAYLYKVRAIGPSGLAGPDSGVDLGTAIVFTDDPLLVSTTPVKAVHLAQLRDAVTAVRALADMAPVIFIDASSPGVTVKAGHISQLRGALDSARAALGLPAAVYTRALAAGSTLIAAIDFTELRNGVK